MADGYLQLNGGLTLHHWRVTGRITSLAWHSSNNQIATLACM